MKRKAILILALLAALLAALTLTANAAQSPYAIKVNRLQNVVTVYTQDGQGNYTVPYKAMICSTGRTGHRTPLGTYKTSTGKKAWCLMVDGSYGQYSTRFNGHILFHSVCYYAADPAKLITKEYDLLGSPASLGCVRLQVCDAKWIYDNVPSGTSVTVYESEDPGPLGKPCRAVDRLADSPLSGWDPTDPRDNNPWKNELLPFDDLSWGLWYYDSVKNVCAAGMMQGEGNRRFHPDGTVNAAVICKVLMNLSGEPADEGEFWYSGAISWAQSAEIWCGEDALAPLSREELMTAIWNYMGRPASEQSLEAYPDAEQIGENAFSAMRWAVETGILKGNGSELLPHGTVTRVQLAAILERLNAMQPEAEGACGS